MIETEIKNYDQLYRKAASQKDKQEVGETLQSLTKKLEQIVNEVVQKQAEHCFIKGFFLKKYYIHIMITKDETASRLYGAPNVIRIRNPQCRITRPSPYQEEDHYLWSVENLNNIKFEWCIPKKEVMEYILKNPSDFDPQYVSMLHRYKYDKLEDIRDYMVEGKVI